MSRTSSHLCVHPFSILGAGSTGTSPVSMANRQLCDSVEVGKLMLSWLFLVVLV